jgi:2'-hydroxyisoflavone reductase
MELLILGGTVFLGRHLVESAQARGHQVTLFNRGKTRPDLFPEVEKLRGDRDHDLDALLGRRWDAAIDTSGYVPRIVRTSTELLADAVERYVFISSISAYADLSKAGSAETAPLASLPDPSVETLTGETYGALKALCEFVAEVAMPDRVLIVRPGLIVGPHDPTDRFTYWIRRIAQGGDILAPAPPDAPVQFIHARDLSDWIIAMVEGGTHGIFNATGPAGGLSFGTMLETCRNVIASTADFLWVEPDFLLAQGVEPWTELPLWVPPGEEGMLMVDISKALQAGLSPRPLQETIADTHAWDRGRGLDQPLRGGLTAQHERALLRAWRQSDPDAPPKSSFLV